MVAVVADYVVVLAQQLGDDAAVHGKTGGKYQRIVHANELCQFLFQFHVDVKCAIQKTAACTTAAVLAHGCYTCLYDAVVSGKTGVCITTKHQHIVAAHSNLCALLALNLTEIGVNTFCLNLVWQCVLGQLVL